MEKRGIIKGQSYLTSERVEMSFELPLSEIVFDFFDKLKTISRGYASLDYELIGFRESDMVKLDVMLNGEKVDALSAIVHRSKSYEWGKRLCEKLRELLPRQMFDIAIQASHRPENHCPRNREGPAQKRNCQVLRRRHQPQAQAARKAERRQEADALGGLGGNSAGSVSGGA